MPAISVLDWVHRRKTNAGKSRLCRQVKQTQLLWALRCIRLLTDEEEQLGNPDEAMYPYTAAVATARPRLAAQVKPTNYSQLWSTHLSCIHIWWSHLYNIYLCWFPLYCTHRLCSHRCCRNLYLALFWSTHFCFCFCFTLVLSPLQP